MAPPSVVVDDWEGLKSERRVQISDADQERSVKPNLFHIPLTFFSGQAGEWANWTALSGQLATLRYRAWGG